MCLFESEFPKDFGRTMYQTVEHAVPEFLRAYRDKQTRLLSKGSVPSVPEEPEPKRLAELTEMVGRLASDLSDIGDSLKAGQMETMRRLDRKTVQLVEIEHDLENYLSQELFSRLSRETQTFLSKAERLFRVGSEIDDFDPSVQTFQRAYESEFRRCITAPLVKILVDRGHSNYTSVDGKKLVSKGTFGQLTLGQQLWFLQRDELVRSILMHLGFDVPKIDQAASALNATRRNAAHGRTCTYNEAAHVRDMLLGINSILKALFRLSCG
jgi:hypothetical protein